MNQIFKDGQVYHFYDDYPCYQFNVKSECDIIGHYYQVSVYLNYTLIKKETCLQLNRDPVNYAYNLIKRLNNESEGIINE